MRIINEDCRDALQDLINDDVTVDLIVTSPPYDSLRDYKGIEWSFDVFKDIANKLYHILKDGGVLVWVVNDSTIDGSKTGTSFRQALYFKEIGFNLHDVMLFAKNNPLPQIFHKRYTDAFEYMFILSKGKPKTCNPLTEPCKCKGQQAKSFKKITSKGMERVNKSSIINDTKIKSNIWFYTIGESAIKKFRHPAMFPLDLAKDHILSWSNKGDIVLDPFMGSGTTGVACQELDREFIGIEISEEYCNIAYERLKNQQTKLEEYML